MVRDPTTKLPTMPKPALPLSNGLLIAHQVHGHQHAQQLQQDVTFSRLIVWLILTMVCASPAGHVPVECAVTIENTGTVGLSSFRLDTGKPAAYTSLVCSGTGVLDRLVTRACTLTRTVNQVGQSGALCRVNQVQPGSAARNDEEDCIANRRQSSASC